MVIDSFTTATLLISTTFQNSFLLSTNPCTFQQPKLSFYFSTLSRSRTKGSTDSYDRSLELVMDRAYTMWMRKLLHLQPQISVGLKMSRYMLERLG